MIESILLIVGTLILIFLVGGILLVARTPQSAAG